ncbi:hypothetical protein [Micromonospora endolithica]|uniref:Uncharacterized protein n=1 Tax=Micromonospora endolithica TaxID=230091 RepID=A0A3A9ZH35_9ACTN|nr:hypothetical protein [Micromonospora endolithica]RKN47613.1 hypothetical protein D7223_12670 [Micromonospora endolithica]
MPGQVRGGLPDRQQPLRDSPVPALDQQLDFDSVTGQERPMTAFSRISTRICGAASASSNPTSWRR